MNNNFDNNNVEIDKNQIKTHKPTKDTKKRLLTNRNAEIKPEKKFDLNDIQPTKKPRERTPVVKDTTVRVKRSTRNKLNALVSLNKADTIDELIEILIDEYMSANILKDEKKHYDLILDLYKLKE